VGEKQVRVSEDTPTGTEIFTVRAFPRRSFSIQALDGVSVAIFAFFFTCSFVDVFTLHYEECY
jgi:hypothetical protein